MALNYKYKIDELFVIVRWKACLNLFGNIPYILKYTYSYEVNK